jgi:hypothetical protein
MADIKSAVTFSAELAGFIASKFSDPTFTYRDWDKDDLEGLRGHIRTHYRQVQLGSCSYCRKDVSLQAAMNCHVEHIAPKSKYQSFMFEPKNLCVICADCNTIKREQEVLQEVPDTVVRGSTRRQYPRSGSAFKIVHPHFDDYNDHIEMFGLFYVDKTDKGHFTIGACRLNRKLRAFGWEAEYNETDVATAAAAYLNAAEPNARSRALRVLKRKLVLT